MEKISFLTEILEPYTKTPEGIPLWKTKGILPNYENLLDHIFVL